MEKDYSVKNAKDLNVNLRKRQRHQRLRAQLHNERSSFIAHWHELSDLILPRRSRFFTDDVNRGERRNLEIIDSTATLATRTLRSGMMSGITNPARPWFRLTFPDKEIAEVDSVKKWLADVEKAMNTAFVQSNLYNVLPILYGDIGVFGSSAMLVDEDADTGIRCYPFPIGSFYIAENEKGQVDTFVRDFQMTVRQIVDKFGRDKEKPEKIDWTNISTHVKHQWENRQRENWVDLFHVIEPNDLYDPTKNMSKYKKFQSTYYEQGFTNQASGGSTGSSLGGVDGGKILRTSGYDYFPIMAPRWEVVAEDVYGTDCPGMTALGDIKQLQIGERRSAQAVDKMVNPPMVAPVSLKNARASILPGDITYINDREVGSAFRAAHEVNFRVDLLEAKQQQIRERITRSFYEDLFLMLANTDRRQITAREIEERHEEKLLALGPVLEQLNQDLLDPLIDVTFAILNKQEKIPPPPEVIAGKDLKVEYISIMAQAQKLVGLGGIERFTGYVFNLAQANPEVLDKLNLDEVVDLYGELTSIPTGIIRENGEVEEIRAQRQQAQAQAQQAQQLQAASQGAKTLSETNTSDQSALTDLLASEGEG